MLQIGLAAPASLETNPPAIVSGVSSPSPATPIARNLNPTAHVTPPVVANGAVVAAKRPTRVMPTPVIPTGPSAMPKPKLAAAAAAARRATPDGIANGLKQLSIESRTPNLVVNGTTSSSANSPRPAAQRQPSSQNSPKADSGSDVSTKPPSLDGKSVASMNVLDEKESLRPDDSASVKATAEEDDVSIRGSLIAGRIGSDLAMRARGIALGDAIVPDRRPVVASGTIPSGPGIMTPQSTSSDQQGATSTSLSSDALNLIYRQHPDEKLLDAMKSPRDRLFLLRLEGQLINFVQNSKEPYMDVREGPEKSLNTFYRMLAHKLADYYHMTHSYEPAIDAVRIFRTPFCRVPTSLLSVAAANNSTSNGNTPPPVVLPRKIMKRGEEANAGQQSGSPSKATYEVGSEFKDRPTPAKESRPTRSEREEAYKLARERIFGTEQTENDIDNSESRASSVSAKDKVTGKRGRVTRQRRDSDGFDSRHHYAPYWVSNPQVWPPQPQYMQIPPSGHYPPQMPGGYPPPPLAAGYPQPPNSSFSPALPQGPYPGPAPYAVAQPPPPPVPQFPPQPVPQPARYPPVNGTSPIMGYGSPITPTGPQGHQPQPSTNCPPGPPGPPGPPFQNRGPGSSPNPMQPGIPYAYGQLPVNNAKDPKNQHPIPGSYQRNTAGFNPKTQSFVPGGNPMGPIHPPPTPTFGGPDSHHSSPQPPIPLSPHMAYAGGFHPPMPPPHQFPNAGYSMARQPSTSSMPPYHGPPHGPPYMALPPQPMPQVHPQVHHPEPQLPASLPPHPPQPITHLPHHSPNLPNKPIIPQGPAMMAGPHLAAYPPPAGLPQKPATGI